MKYSNFSVRCLILCFPQSQTYRCWEVRKICKRGRQESQETTPTLPEILPLSPPSLVAEREGKYPSQEHVQTSNPRLQANWKQLQCGPEPGFNLTPALHRVWSLLMPEVNTRPSSSTSLWPTLGMENSRGSASCSPFWATGTPGNVCMRWESFPCLKQKLKHFKQKLKLTSFHIARNLSIGERQFNGIIPLFKLSIKSNTIFFFPLKKENQNKT